MSKKNKNDDLFGDDSQDASQSAHVQNDFAAMLAQSEKAPTKRLSAGDQLRGEILSIGKEDAFVSIGTATDGIILLKDLLDENKQLKYKVGDFIDVVVTRAREGEVRLTRKGASSASGEMDSLEDAHDMELPVEGRVIETCNGGFRVSVQGKTAFCPISQIDSRSVKDAQEYVGKKFDFLITQFDPRGRNLVVSRRRVLDLQKAENEGAFMQKHEVGALLNGKITRLEKFGAFVELESGIEGLVHISELSWSRVSDPSEIVQVGMPVQVKLLKTEDLNGKLKISLSLKQGGGEGDPWMTVPQKFPRGTVLKGQVEKKEVYGLFVNIAPGITGLLPKSKWRDSVDVQQYENKKKGDTITVQVDEIQFADRKISLGLPQEAEDQSWRTHTTTSGFGTLGDLFKKK